MFKSQHVFFDLYTSWKLQVCIPELRVCLGTNTSNSCLFVYKKSYKCSMDGVYELGLNY